MKNSNSGKKFPSLDRLVFLFTVSVLVVSVLMGFFVFPNEVMSVYKWIFLAAFGVTFILALYARRDNEDDKSIKELENWNCGGVGSKNRVSISFAACLILLSIIWVYFAIKFHLVPMRVGYVVAPSFLAFLVAWVLLLLSSEVVRNSWAYMILCASFLIFFSIIWIFISVNTVAPENEYRFSIIFFPPVALFLSSMVLFFTPLVLWLLSQANVFDNCSHK